MGMHGVCDILLQVCIRHDMDCGCVCARDWLSASACLCNKYNNLLRWFLQAAQSCAL